jgi:Cys-rich repeat protein
MVRALPALASLLGIALTLSGCGELSLNLPIGDAGLAPSEEAGPAGSGITPCTTAAQCVDAGGATTCDVEAGACVECLSNADCSGSTPHCVRGACVSCTTDADCATGMVCNTHIPRCETMCSNGTQCDNGPCSTEYGYCVECLSDLDCTTAGLPYCDEPPAVGLCVGCRSNADCDGSVCGPSLHCE